MIEEFLAAFQVSLVFRSVSDTFSKPVDIPRGQSGELYVVARQDGLTHSDLAEQLAVYVVDMTGTLQHPEKDDLGIRRSDAEINWLGRFHLTEVKKQNERRLISSLAVC